MSHPALRVAVIQRGRIIDERLFTSRANVTVGTDVKSTFLVPSDDAPPLLSVLQVDRDGATRLGAGLDGTVSVDGATVAASDWIATTPLPRSAKGRLSVGDVSLVFHFVDAPTPRPRPELPKALRKSALAQFDKLFMAMLVVSLGAHFAGVGYIASQPPPPEAPEWDPQLPPDRFARAMILPTPKPKQPEATNDEQPSAPKPKPTEVAAAPTPKKPGLSGDALKERLKKMGMMAVIGSRGEGNGAFGDLLDHNVGDVAKALTGLSELRVGSAEDAVAVGRRGNETGESERIGPLGPDGPITRRVDLNEREPAAIPGELKTGTIEVETPDIDPDDLAKWMKQRKAAILGCYERELKRLPTLSGRVVLHFNITTRGRVGDVGFQDNTLRSANVESCIQGVMRTWVTPFSPDDDVPVTLPFIFAPSSNR